MFKERMANLVDVISNLQLNAIDICGLRVSMASFNL